MGNDDLYKFLLVKRELCINDIAIEFGTSRQYANKMMNILLKHEEIGYKYKIIEKGPKKFAVKYIFIKF